MPTQDITTYPMFPPDSLKSAFITQTGMYCYNMMPFGLKNVGVSNQHIMVRMSKPLIGKIVEVYINDMLVTLESWVNHLARQKEAFQLMRHH